MHVVGDRSAPRQHSSPDKGPDTTLGTIFGDDGLVSSENGMAVQESGNQERSQVSLGRTDQPSAGSSDMVVEEELQVRSRDLSMGGTSRKFQLNRLLF